MSLSFVLVLSLLCMFHTISSDADVWFTFKTPQFKKHFVVSPENDINITFMVPNITIPITMPKMYFMNDMHQILMMFQ